MFGKKQLKELSHICAYCGRALKEEYRTFDHIIPKSAGGKGYANNIVICCKKCNLEKANQDVESFLSLSSQREENFYNYLHLIDNQRGNKNYSEQILKKIGQSSYSYMRKKKRNKFKVSKQSHQKEIIRIIEPQNIEYDIFGPDFNLNVNVSETQMKILEFYMNSPNFTDYKEVAKQLGLSNSAFMNNIVQINNLTGIFPLKLVSQNGFKMNELFYKYLKIQKSK